MGLFGLAISVAGIATPGVWYDEAATISSTTRSWPQLWAMLDNVDAVHGLYYVMMHAIFDVVGYSPTALRMPSALAVGLTAALVVVLGRQLGRERLGVIAGFVFCLLPRVTWMGGEGRSYAITALVAVTLTVILLAARHGSRGWWIAYGVVALLGCALFLYLALVVVAHGVTLAWQSVRTAPGARTQLRQWALATVAAGTLMLPLALEIISQDGQVAWISPIGAHTIPEVIRIQWFYGSWPFAVVGWALVALGIARALRAKDRQLMETIGPALLLPTAALITISLVHAPLYQPRYLSMGTPFIAVAIAAGIVALRHRLAIVAVLLLVCALAVPQIVAERMPEAKENSSWSQVAGLIESERAADAPGTVTAIIYGNVQRHPSATTRVIEYSYPSAFAGTIDLTLRTPAAETAQLWETHTPLAESTARLRDVDVAYLITSNARDLRPQTIATLASVGWSVTETWDFTAVHVLRFEPTSQKTS